MSDEPRDPGFEDEPADDGDPTDPAGQDEHGLGLTEEFRRLESEIEDETGGRRDVRFDETDSTEFVAPVSRPGGDGAAHDTDEWAATDAYASADRDEGAPDGNEGDDEGGEPSVAFFGEAADDASPAPERAGFGDATQPFEAVSEPTGSGEDASSADVDPTEDDSGAEVAADPAEDDVRAEAAADPTEDDTGAEVAADPAEAPDVAVEDAPSELPDGVPAEADLSDQPEPEVPAVAAHADQPATEHTVVRLQPAAAAPIPIPAGAYPGPMDEEEIKDRTPALWWRFLTGSVMVVASIATAVALSLLLSLNSIAGELNSLKFRDDGVLTMIDPGNPETILIVGSDKRSNTPGDPGRSDTTMLLRVDAQNEVLSLFSLPRDLKVDIAGQSFGEAKLNEAYTDGGIEKTTKTVKELTGLDINHVVNVDFQGFADAVDAIGCVYVDVDRHYFNDNSTALSEADTYAAINVNAGYQRLCGQNALDYVRYRHTDNDFVRAARQQDFLRNARAQVPVKEVLPIIGGDTGSKLIDIFTKYTSSDINDPSQVISVLKAFIGVRDVGIKEVHFDARDTIENGVSYVEASDSQIKKAVKQFLGDEDTEGGPSSAPSASKEESKPKSKDKKMKDKKKKDEASVSDADVIPIDDSYARFGRTSARRLKKLSVFVPQSVAPESVYDDDSRQYDIKDEGDKKQPAYKLVVQLTSNVAAGQFYGVEGTAWSDPPILDNPSESRKIGDRTYDLYYDGDRLRIVAFHESGNSYWVTNTLLQTLDEQQMLAIAASMTEVKG